MLHLLKNFVALLVNTILIPLVFQLRRMQEMLSKMQAQIRPGAPPGGPPGAPVNNNTINVANGQMNGHPSPQKTQLKAEERNQEHV